MSDRFTPPWEQTVWRAKAEAWIREQLVRQGVSVSGRIEQPHIRPWSTVLRVPTGRTNVWFKAGGPTQVFEPALLALLGERSPDDTLPLLAVEPRRGWSLLPDGGPTMRQVLQGKEDLEVWKAILNQYGKLQVAASDWIEDLRSLGMPDHDPDLLPKIYIQILSDVKLSLVRAEEDFLNEAQYEQLLQLRPTIQQMCAELVASPIPMSLEHGDLQDANIFAQGTNYKIFDWGDASLTHPFFTLILPIRRMADKLGVSETSEHPALIGLRHAYLRPWAEFASFERLQAAWDVAFHLGKFARAINWYRVVKTTRTDLGKQYQRLISVWFLEFLAHGKSQF